MFDYKNVRKSNFVFDNVPHILNGIKINGIWRHSMIVAFFTNNFFKKPNVKRAACDGALSCINIIFFFLYQGSRKSLKMLYMFQQLSLHPILNSKRTDRFIIDDACPEHNSTTSLLGS